MQKAEGISETKEREKIHTPEESTEMLRYLVQNCATKDDLENLKGELEGKIDGLARRLGGVEEKVERLDEKMGGVEEKVEGLAEKMVTKEDLKKVIGETKHELMDHTTRECAKVRGDLTAIAHRQDEKANEFIRTAQKSGTISKADGVRLITINPFAQPMD